MSSVPRGTLRISCPSWYVGHKLVGHFAEFRRRYPEVVLDVSFDDRTVDLVEEGYDAALWLTPSDALSPGLVAEPVRPVSYFLAASAAYAERHGLPRSPDELAQHSFVALGDQNSLEFMGPDGKIEVPVRVVLRYRSPLGLANAVASGIGLAPLPGVLFEDPEFRTRLTPVLLEYPLSQRMLHVVYVNRRYLPLKVRAFRDLIVERVSNSSEPRPLPPSGVQ